MIILVNNTEDLNQAYMTPKLIEYLEKKQVHYTVIKSSENFHDLIEKEGAELKITAIIFEWRTNLFE